LFFGFTSYEGSSLANEEKGESEKLACEFAENSLGTASCT